MSQLLHFLENNESLDEIARYLDWLSHESRLNEIYHLPSKAQALLYQKGRRVENLQTLIPLSLSPYKQIIFYGINTLKAFRHFQKRLCRTHNADELIGYNYQPMSWMTGPGYFVAVNDINNHKREIFFDYTKNIEKVPEVWPSFHSNRRGLAKLVYGGLKDYLRQVSEHVFISEAVKDEKTVGCFLLCREEFPVK